MQRVVVYGVTGSGKTTLARDIAERTGLPMVSVDDEVGWLPDWVERPEPEQREIVAAIVARDRWVLDTAYGKWRDLPMGRAEVIVALDYPRWVSFGRLLRRSLARVIDRRPICNGNTETWSTLLSRESILVWHYRSFPRKRRLIRQWVAQPPVSQIVHLRSPRQARRWLAGLEQRKPDEADAGDL